MRSHRLTFDPNPEKLARRATAGGHVMLLWSRRRHRAAVVVAEDATGELVQLDIRERENPLDLFEHPYAYLAARGTPGRRAGAPPAEAAAALDQHTAARHSSVRQPASPTQPKEVTTMKKDHEKREIRKDGKRDR